MKTFTTILFVISSCFACAQKIVFKKVVEVTKSEFQSHLLPVNPLYKSSKYKKINGVILIKTLNKKIVLKDDGEMLQYEYQGKVKQTSLILIHEIEPNSKEYYFVNIITGKIDTLVGEPVFFPNIKDIACIEGMGTDVKQRIQIGTINRDGFTTKAFFRIQGNIFPGSVFWLSKTTLALDDNDTKFYKLSF